MHLTLEQVVKRNNNNFDLIRLSAAIAVIYGHSFALFPTNGQVEIVRFFLVKEYSGSLAVFAFFFLSGIFITASFINSETHFQFIIKRVFRIWPALIVCILITVFIIGPIFTNLNISSYFMSRQTWHYLIKNSIMLKFEPKLADIFSNNLFKESPNGSLWTLPTEIRCYILVLILGIAGLLKRKITVVAIFLFSLIYHHSNFITSLAFGGLIMPMIFFLAGTLSYKFKEYLIIDYKIEIGLIVGCIAAYFINQHAFWVIFYCTFLYSILFIASTKTIRRIKLPGDYSYGIYIYGFLIQQMIAHLLPQITAYPSMLISIPVTVVISIISWHYIELPSLKLGKKLIEKTRFSTKAYLNV